MYVEIANLSEAQITQTITIELKCLSLDDTANCKQRNLYDI